MSLASEWSPRNGELRLADLSPGSERKAWWICHLGHEWQATMGNRSAGKGCPFCANRRVLPGFNDLASKHPGLAAEWAQDLNGDLQPTAVTAGSNKKAWWRCSKGDEWQATIASRSAGRGCPVCANRLVVPGRNDLATTHPHLANQWSASRNKTTAAAVTAGSSRKAWWRCTAGHEWAALISHRAKGVGCPVCANKAVLVGVNDLQTLRPDIAAQWHPRLNTDTPSDVQPGTASKRWWQCAAGHEWEASVSKRNFGNGCPVCSNRQVVIGFNDLATTHPEVAKTWHPSLNASRTPSGFVAGSHEQAWWLCEQGHEWRTSIGARTGGTSCPVCAQRIVLAGFNDLQTANPELASEWHPSANGELTPEQVTYGSQRAVWWKGDCGHEWVATPMDRSRRGRPTGCPRCSRAVSAPEADLGALIDALVGTGSYAKNARLSDKKRSVDIAIDSRRLAIEYNGTYWHSEANGRTQRTHFEKWAALRSDGYELFVVWSDDWAMPNRRAVIVRMLAHRLGALDNLAAGLSAVGVPASAETVALQASSVGARSLTVRPISRAAAVAFLDDNHVQGSAPMVTSFALVGDQNVVRAVLSVRSQGQGVWEIVRYASSGVVAGGFTRLLRHAALLLRAQGKSVASWVTFSDNSISRGSLYGATGFVAEAEVAPDYSYWIPDNLGGHREHKFNYRVSRFREREDLFYAEGMTEADLASANGIFRIWDYGKVRWRREA